MGAESLGLAISNIQDYSTARGAAGALFDIIDMVSLAELHNIICNLYICTCVIIVYEHKKFV